MSVPETGWHTGQQIHVNKLDPRTGKVTPGWEITVYDEQTGNELPLFVPDVKYSAENVQILADAAIKVQREVHNLGR